MLLPAPLRPIFDSFENNLSKNDTLIVGVSGGPDSTFLLHALKRFSRKNPLTLIVAHVNHGIRGRAAKHDELFTKKLAAELELAYEVKRVTLKGTGLEEKGRNVRRAFFEALAKKYKAQAIVTAHTQDDQLETILFNMIRGAFVGGMAGMRERLGLYYKPLLAVTKGEILLYLKKNKLGFCTDAMNGDTAYTRVFLRKKVIPLLRKINPSLNQTIARNAQLFAQLDDDLAR